MYKDPPPLRTCRLTNATFPFSLAFSARNKMTSGSGSGSSTGAGAGEATGDGCAGFGELEPEAVGSFGLK